MSKYHSYCSSSSSCFSSQSFSHVDSCSPSPGVASWSATPWAPAGSPRAAARAEAREPRRAWTRSWAPHFIRLEKSSMRRPEFKAGVWIWIWVILFDVWFWEILGVFWRYFGNLDLGMWFDARRLRLERLQVTCNAANIVIVFLRDHSILHSLLQFLIAWWSCCMCPYSFHLQGDSETHVLAWRLARRVCWSELAPSDTRVTVCYGKSPFCYRQIMARNGQFSTASCEMTENYRMDISTIYYLHNIP